jgi:hypothetical protein
MVSTAIPTTARPGNVVENDRNIDGVGHRHEVAILPFLGRLVVIAGDMQDGVAADFLGMTGAHDGFFGRVRPGAGNHRHPALGLFHAKLDHPGVFVMAQGRRFAGGAAGNQALGALFDLPVHQFAERRLIHLAILERGDQGGDGAFDAVVDAGHDGVPVFLMGPVTFMPEDRSHYGLPDGSPSKLIQTFQQASRPVIRPCPFRVPAFFPFLSAAP